MNRKDTQMEWNKKISAQKDVEKFAFSYHISKNKVSKWRLRSCWRWYLWLTLVHWR